MLYKSDFEVISVTKGWKLTKEQILNGSCKLLPFIMVSLVVIF